MPSCSALPKGRPKGKDHHPGEVYGHCGICSQSTRSGQNGLRLPVQHSRSRWYGHDVEEALLVLWKAANFICAKRLIPFFPELIPESERHGYLSLSQETREKLLSMSPCNRRSDPN